MNKKCSYIHMRVFVRVYAYMRGCVCGHVRMCVCVRSCECTCAYEHVSLDAFVCAREYAYF